MENTPEGNLRGAAGQVPHEKKVKELHIHAKTKQLEVWGDTYPIKEALKALKFHWDGMFKIWVKYVSVDESLKIIVELAKYAEKTEALINRDLTAEEEKRLKEAGVKIVY